MPPRRLATHLFGSRDGYRGLAHSQDLSAAERRELETFGFGEASDASLLASLERTPSAFGRPLPGGRIAVTRLFAGPLDDASRPTLELRSVVASPPDLLEIARGGIEQLLGDESLWRREAFEAGREVAFETRPPRPLSGAGHLTIFEQWARLAADAGDAGRPRPMLLLEPEAEGSEAISELLARLAPEDLWSLRWGIRLLASGGLAELGTLAAGVRWRGDRPFRRVSVGAGIESPRFASRLAEWPGAPMLPPRSEAAEWFDERRRVAAPSSRPQRRSHLPAAAAMLAIATAALLWWFLLRGDGAAEPPEAIGTADAGTGAAEATASTPAASAEREAAAGRSGWPQGGFGGGDRAEPASNETADAGVAPIGVEGGTRLRIGIDSPLPRSRDGVSPPPDAAEAAEAAEEAEESIEGDAEATPAEDASEVPPPADATDDAAADGAGASDPSPEAVPSDEATDSEPTTDSDSASESEAADRGAISLADPCVEAAAVRAKVLDGAGELEALLARNPPRWERIDAILGEMEASLRTLGLDRIEEPQRRFVLQLLRERRVPLSEASLTEQWPLVRRLHCGWLAWLEASAAIEAAGSRLAARPAMRTLLQLRGESLWVVTATRPSREALLERQRTILAGLAADARHQGQPPRFSLWLEEAAAERLSMEALQSPPKDPQDDSGPPVR